MSAHPGTVRGALFAGITFGLLLCFGLRPFFAWVAFGGQFLINHFQ